jgi:hypothetical protein
MVQGWSNEKRKSTIDHLLHDGLSPDESIRLAFLTEKKETQSLCNAEFTEFKNLSEKRCHLVLQKMRAAPENNLGGRIYRGLDGN